jgi:hypothetical protein
MTESERMTIDEALNWLRRQANAETNSEKRAAFVEAYNAIKGERTIKDRVASGEAVALTAEELRELGKIT